VALDFAGYATTVPGMKSLSALALAMFGALAPADAEFTFRVVAIQGQTAPTAEPGVTFGGFGEPAIDNAGNVAFRAFLQGTTETANLGIYLQPPAGLPVEVVREGAAVPGTEPGVTLRVTNGMSFTAGGRLVYQADLNPIVNDSALFFQTPGGDALVARRNQPMPLAGSPLASGFFNPLGLSGSTAIFHAFFSESGSLKQALMIGGPGTLRALFRSGDVPPNVTQGETLEGFDALGGGQGRIAFISRLLGGDANRRIGVWTGVEGAIELVARTGDPAPTAGEFFEGFTFSPSTNATGGIAFVGTTRSFGFFNEEVFARLNGTLVSIAGLGDTTDEGDKFNLFFATQIDARNRVYFIGKVNGVNTGSASVILDSGTDGVFMREPGGPVRAIVREGDTLNLGSLGSRVVTNVATDALKVNASGDLVFTVRLDDTTNALLRVKEAPPVDATPPSLAVKGKKKITTTAGTVRLRGTAEDAGGLARVEFRIGTKGKFRPAKNTTAWSARIGLKPGRNVVTLRAVDTAGNASATQKVTIVRQR
jgi:hypothetical protein